MKTETEKSIEEIHNEWFKRKGITKANLSSKKIERFGIWLIAFSTGVMATSFVWLLVSIFLL